MFQLPHCRMSEVTHHSCWLHFQFGLFEVPTDKFQVQAFLSSGHCQHTGWKILSEKCHEMSLLVPRKWQHLLFFKLLHCFNPVSFSPSQEFEDTYMMSGCRNMMAGSYYMISGCCDIMPGCHGRMLRCRDMMLRCRDMMPGWRDMMPGCRDMMSGWCDIMPGCHDLKLECCDMPHLIYIRCHGVSQSYDNILYKCRESIKNKLMNLFMFYVSLSTVNTKYCKTQTQTQFPPV